MWPIRAFETSRTIYSMTQRDSLNFHCYCVVERFQVISIIFSAAYDRISFSNNPFHLLQVPFPSMLFCKHSECNSIRWKTQITPPRGSHLLVCCKRLNAGPSKCESRQIASVVTHKQMHRKHSLMLLFQYAMHYVRKSAESYQQLVRHIHSFVISKWW